MKYLSVFAWLIIGVHIGWSYSAVMDVTVNTRNVEFEVDLTFSEDSIVITIPTRGTFLSLTAGKDDVFYYVSDSRIYVDNAQKKYGGNLQLNYQLPISDTDFVLKEWLPDLGTNGLIDIRFPSSTTHRGLLIPYIEYTNKTFTVDTGNDPIMVFGRYAVETISTQETVYSIYYPYTLHTPFSNIITIFNRYEEMLIPFPQSEKILISLPTGDVKMITNETRAFITINRSHPNDIKDAFTEIWFSRLLGLGEDHTYAFSDFYRRLLDDNGNIRTNALYFVPVLSDQEYESTLMTGLNGDEVIDCDVDAMLNNISMLHFSYFLTGHENFMKSLHTFAMDDTEKTYTAHFKILPDVEIRYVKYIVTNLFPVADTVPDLSIIDGYAGKNITSLPDLYVDVDEEILEFEWNGLRKVELPEASNYVHIDPNRFIPQINYYNDWEFYPVSDIKERYLVESVIRLHKHYTGESFRAILYMHKFIAPDDNYYQIEAGSDMYVAVVKFIAPVNGLLTTGLKELVISFAGAKPEVLEDRIRI